MDKHSGGAHLEEKLIFLKKNHTKIMKGVAIICVVLSHIGSANNIRIAAPLGGMGVAIFLICSGYGLNESAKKDFDFKLFWLKRIKAVFLPYAVIRLVVVLARNQFELKTYILDVLCIKPMYSLGWYLTYLLICYMLFYFSEILKYLFGNKVKLSFLTIAFLISFFVSPRTLQAEQSVSFLTGIFLSEETVKDNRFIVDDNPKKTITIIVMLIIMGMVAFSIKQAFTPQTEYVVSFLQLIYKFGWALMLVFLVNLLRKKMSLRFFSFMGTISYEIFLFHGYFWGLMKNISDIPVFVFIIGGLSIITHMLFNLNKYKVKWIPTHS
jgi:peptidoglycan/LPS O-acetylase OafA/YrhL